jgi:hypothetical protein
VSWHWRIYGHCRIGAAAYQTAVTLRGTNAYRAAQSTQCQCSPCGPRAAHLCYYDGTLDPGVFRWPAWEPPPSGGGFGGF